MQALLEGVPFDTILDDAREWKADVILMGRTGRTGPGRALLGSEAERVLEFTDRPVLIVPTLQVQTPPPGR
jgi:nucleotide-binding universal stress UspA family protein